MSAPGGSRAHISLRTVRPRAKDGGFAPAENALDVNWIICPRTVPIAVSRTDKVRIFDPETNQSARAWAIDYRKYHDLWITDT